jgi:hypothetical protein
MRYAPKRIWIANYNEEQLRKFEDVGQPLMYFLDQKAQIDIEYIRADLFMCMYTAFQELLLNKKRRKDFGWETQVIKKTLNIVNNPDKFKIPDSMENK